MTDHTTPEPMTDIDPLRLILRLLDEVDRIRAQLDRAKAAAAWERGQRRSQSSTLGVKIDQLGIARAEKSALAARLAEAEQARDEARDEATRQRLAALELHHVPFCEVCNDHGPCKTRRILDGDGVTACTGCGTCGACRAHEPATATGAPGPDPSEGTAPNGRTGGTQGPHEAPCLDSPAPLTLAQAATALHDWAGDLDDGANTAWPAGHADVIRGIRAAADWLDARAAYETEAREQQPAAERGAPVDWRAIADQRERELKNAKTEMHRLRALLATVRTNQLGLARAYAETSTRAARRAGKFEWTPAHSAAYAQGEARGAVNAAQFLLMELGEVEYDEAAETTWDLVMSDAAKDAEDDE